MAASDLDCVLAWRNHPDIRRYMYNQHEIGLSEHQAWFERTVCDSRKHLLIFESDGEARGFVSFTRLASDGVADWGFYVAPDAPKGSGYQLGKAALDHAFGALRLHKVCGQALAFNERSIAYHLRLGFREEGVLRDQHFDGSRYHAIVCFGLLKDEWPLHYDERDGQ